ncbi:MAG: type III-A CRISPR-associated RAMP protein Csm4 [Desulfosoma sp.]
MKTYLYHLEFPGGAHFGRQGIGLEETRESFSSDSLFSALINAFSLVGEADEVLAALGSETPPFHLSSLFPYGPDKSDKNSKRLYALPRPMTMPRVQDNSVLRSAGKDLKKIRYLVPEDVVRWLDDRPLTEDDIHAMRTRAARLARPWNEETKEGWHAVFLRPRVALDRNSQNSAIWWCGEIHFSRKAGLFGLVRFQDEAWKPRLEAAFRLLSDMGLGGERTYGLGMFRFDGFTPVEDVWSLNLPEADPRRHVLLSRYVPTKDELGRLPQVLSAWDMEESRGYVVSGRSATTVKRKRVRFLIEGSVAREPLSGRLVDVTPEQGLALGLTHRVYRSGLGFWFP